MAFDKIKRDLAEVVTLAHASPTTQLTLTTDASDDIVGAVVHQVDGRQNTDSGLLLQKTYRSPKEVQHIRQRVNENFPGNNAF